VRRATAELANGADSNEYQRKNNRDSNVRLVQAVFGRKMHRHGAFALPSNNFGADYIAYPLP